MFEHTWFLKEKEALENAQAQNGDYPDKDRNWPGVDGRSTLVVVGTGDQFKQEKLQLTESFILCSFSALYSN